MTEPKLTLDETTARVEANSNANRVSIPSIKAKIARAVYFTAMQGLDGADIAKLRAEKPDFTHTIQPLADDPDMMKSELASLCTMTICVLVMQNGFTFIGYSNCADPANFDAEVGERYAYENAFKQIWSHEAYLIRERLHFVDELNKRMSAEENI